MRLFELQEDTATDLGDFIISQFEADELTYDQAKKKLVDKGLEHYVHELDMADELKKDKEKMH